MLETRMDIPGAQWAGWMHLGDRADFIGLTLLPGGEGALDLPNRGRFQVPLLDLQAVLPAIRFRAGLLTFEGTLTGERIEGMVVEGTVSGNFGLHLVGTLARDEYRRFMGRYAVPRGRQVLVGQDDRSDLPLYFYTDGERVVRLYPLSSGSNHFLSERCETVRFDLGTQGIARSLTWQAEAWGAPGAGIDVAAPRLEWCIEEEVRVEAGGHTLVGTLLLPPGSPPHPAVMLCHHADTHLRDYYRIFAEPFVERGIAAFVYDKRGWGDSSGEPLFSEIFSLAEDAEAVFHAVQKHPAIRSDALGIWGISNGAWVGALAASRVDGAAFVIGASVAGVTPARQEQVRRVNVARDLGASPRALQLIERLWDRLFKFYVDGQWDNDVETALREVYDDEELQRLPKHPDHDPGLQPVPPVRPIEQIRSEYGGAWPEGGFDVAEVYAGLRCPILCVWGERDTVLPVEEGVMRVAHASVAGRHPRCDLRIVPNATHKLYVASPEPEGILNETMHTRLHNVCLAPGVRELMAEWAANLAY